MEEIRYCILPLDEHRSKSKFVHVCPLATLLLADLFAE